MLLSDIKAHLKTQGQQSLFQLSRQFDVQPDILKDMLNLLIRKGQVRQCMKTPRCGKQCGQCSVLVTQLYEWVGVNTELGG